MTDVALCGSAEGAIGDERLPTLETKKQLSAATMRSYNEYIFEKSPAETTSGTVSSDASFTASTGLGF